MSTTQNATELIKFLRASLPTITVNGNTVTIAQQGQSIQIQKTTSQAETRRSIRSR